MLSRPAPIVTADSITRIGPEAKGAVVVNGSHGGVYAAYLAAKLGVAAAIFNDAGIGRDSAGLDYLAQLGIPAATVGAVTARIGDGADMMARGVITHANPLATALGLGRRCALRGYEHAGDPVIGADAVQIMLDDRNNGRVAGADSPMQLVDRRFFEPKLRFTRPAVVARAHLPSSATHPRQYDHPA